MYQADLYIRNKDLQRRDIEKVIQNSVKLLKWSGSGNEMVVDLGCGSGDVTRDVILYNAPNIKEIVGLDISTDMLKYAREYNFHERITYKELNLASKQLSNSFKNCFDHGFSFHVFHWIKDQKQLFKNIYEMLKPGGDMLGLFVVSTDVMYIYERQALMPKWAKYLKCVADIFPYQHYNAPQETIENNLQQAGFSHMVKLEKREFIYLNRELFKISMAVINPFIKDIPKELHEEYMDDFADIAADMNFFADHDNQNQVVIVRYILAVIYLRKPDL